MQIIIPMSGEGKRFRTAGYKTLKPLINVAGRPIIAHIIDLFPVETNFLFICNELHLKNKKLNLKKILLKYCPTAQIVAIKPHKLGPVHAILQAKKQILLKEKIIVNYCDFSCLWDFSKFKNMCSDTNIHGIIPSYKNFHPHSLGKTNYAYLKTIGNKVVDIKEKEPFTNDKMNEFASSGTYFFSSGQLMIEAMEFVYSNNLSVSGEFYVSLCYKYLFKKGYNVQIFKINHFMQWGTPEDLEEFLYWEDTFKKIQQKKTNKQTLGFNIMPMAGFGKRFSEQGFKKIKPLILVNKYPMFVSAINDLPSSFKNVFVIREDKNNKELLQNIEKYFPESIIFELKKPTQGQAVTSAFALKELKHKIENLDKPITFGSCDNGIIYNFNIFKEILINKNTDVIVWGVENYFYAKKHPSMYGWIDERNGDILRVSVKKTINNDVNKPVIIGAFTFKNYEIFFKSYDMMLKEKSLVNGEYYLDELVNYSIRNGYNCKYFKVDKYLSWGTPNEYKTFNYWQECFSKWKFHDFS